MRQTHFLKEVNASGGSAIVAHSVDELQAELGKYL